jgi:hypothetical protein
MRADAGVGGCTGVCGFGSDKDIGMALREPVGAAQTRMHHAKRLRQMLPTTRRLFRSGAINAKQADAIVEATSGVKDPRLAAAVEDRVLTSQGALAKTAKEADVVFHSGDDGVAATTTEARGGGFRAELPCWPASQPRRRLTLLQRDGGCARYSAAPHHLRRPPRAVERSSPAASRRPERPCASSPSSLAQVAKPSRWALGTWATASPVPPGVPRQLAAAGCSITTPSWPTLTGVRVGDHGVDGGFSA